ncbi:MAG: CapA family protein [Chloroflexi bacterium]|nr:CapA family protein [Chloroflexota bacterium]
MDRKTARRRERRDQDRHFILTIFAIILAVIVLWVAFSAFAAAPRAEPRVEIADAPTATAFPFTPAPTVTRIPTPTLTPLPPKLVALGDEITATVRVSITHAIRGLGWNIAERNARPDVAVHAQISENAQVLTERVYVVADWFATTRTNLASSDVRALWRGQAMPDGITTILASDETIADIAWLWDTPGANVKRVAANELVAQLWANHNALAIVPFDAFSPKLRALALDEYNILQRDAPLDLYPLVWRAYVNGDPGIVNALRQRVVATNRDVTQMTTLVMTGSSAIARTSAQKTDERGDPALAARLVAPVLAAADLTHVSNEVPFTADCKPILRVVTLCSKPEYLAAYQLAGVDLVGLTGNHLLDYGQPAFLKTLDLYDTNKIRYYGGGRNASDARKILYVEDHGNRLAFLGVNSFGPPTVWATETKPGARRYLVDELKRDLTEARQRADVVLIEYQAEENYDYAPYFGNRTLFRTALDTGADVVTGMQAHQPQAIEFNPDGSRIILYGLGNFFFDQMYADNVRQGLVARHTIYRHKLIQTELLPTVLEDYVQPRWATSAERAEIFRLVFSASGFK